MAAKRPDREYIRDQIALLYANGHTAPQISHILSTDLKITSPITLSTVKNDIFHLRLERYIHEEDHPWKDTELRELEYLHGQGWDIIKLSQRVNHNYESVLSKLYITGLINRRLTPAQSRTVRYYLQHTCLTPSDIAETMGIKYSSVRYVWSKLKHNVRLTATRNVG